MVEVIIIVGDSNSGKSTLVRGLTGKGNDSHQHVNTQKNVLELEWAGTGTRSTLVMNSSLNEGTKYNPLNNISYTSHNTVHPLDVEKFLTEYAMAIQKSGGYLTKAILCISSSKQPQGWSDDDYSLVLVNGSFGNHPITHVVELSGISPFNGIAAFWPRPAVIANSIQNVTAASVRKFLNLT